MKRAIKFRVRLVEAGIFILFILLLGFSAGVRSTYKTRNMNQWVSHARQVLTEAASVRLHRARIQDDLWLYRETEREGLSKFQETVKQYGVYWLFVNHAAPEPVHRAE